MTRNASWRRLTVSRLMLLIAAVALALGGGRWAYKMWPEVEHRRLCAGYQVFEARRWVLNAAAIGRREVSVQRYPRTEFSAKKYSKYSLNNDYIYIIRKHTLAGGLEIFSADDDPPGYREESTAVCRERAAYHERMRRKWARAAWTPWTTVAPDPPMPPIIEFEPIHGPY